MQKSSYQNDVDNIVNQISKIYPNLIVLNSKQVASILGMNEVTLRSKIKNNDYIFKYINTNTKGKNVGYTFSVYAIAKGIVNAEMQGKSMKIKNLK